MKIIKYTVEITGMNNKGKQVKIFTQASNATELFKNITDILDKNSKTWIEKILNLVK